MRIVKRMETLPTHRVGSGDGSERRPNNCRAGRSCNDRACASDRLSVGQGAGSYALVEARCSCLRRCDRSPKKRPGGKIWVPPCGYAVNFLPWARSGSGGSPGDLHSVGCPDFLQGKLQSVSHRALDPASRATVLKLPP